MRLIAFLLLCIGCVGESEDGGGGGGPADDIYFGEPSVPAEDYAFSIEDYNGGTECTGALLSPHWALTARHCVSPRVSALSLNPVPTNPPIVDDGTNQSPKCSWYAWGEDWVTYTNYARFGRERGGRRVRVVGSAHTASVWVCGSDFALIRLQEDVTDFPTVSIGSQPPVVGSTVAVIGWGESSSTPNSIPITRERKRLRVTGLEFPTPLPSDANQVLYPIAGEFTVSAGPCHGDSGGPIVQDGFVVGVVSRGLGSCTEDDTVITDVTRYRAFIECVVTNDSVEVCGGAGRDDRATVPRD